MRFKLILDASAGEPRWEHDFEVFSVEMAVDYTQRLMAHSRAIAALGCQVSLYNMDAEGTVVNRFKLAPPTVERQFS